MLDSKEIIQSILKNENIALYSNVKVINRLVCVACVKVSIESVVESLLSRYEKHFDSSFKYIERNDHCWEHTVTAANHAGDGKLLILHLNEDIRLYIGNCSKVVGKLLDQKSKLPFI